MIDAIQRNASVLTAQGFPREIAIFEACRFFDGRMDYFDEIVGEALPDKNMLLGCFSKVGVPLLLDSTAVTSLPWPKATAESFGTA